MSALPTDELPGGAGPPSEPCDKETPESGDASSAGAFLREVARAPATAPSQAGDLSGRTLGRYRVLARLGRGAMGVVYAAEDETLRRSVALKVLPAHLLGDPDRRRRFLREARAAAAAAHPNIAAIYDVVIADDQVFIAMERVAGRTLRDVIAGAEGRGLPWRLVTRVAHGIACGLAQAHEAGVIHRDLKPENVMIGPAHDGRAFPDPSCVEIKILDFGVAKLREDRPADPSRSRWGRPPNPRPSRLPSDPVTEAGQLLGTPSYMAPEQAKSLAVDGRTDIFSLGVMLYEMATGARPFTGATSVAILAAVLRDDPAPPSRQNPAVPPALSRIIVRCLEKHAADRYPSAAELAKDLLRAESGEGAPRARAAELLAQRRRWWVGGLASLAALGVLAVPVLTHRDAGVSHGSAGGSGVLASSLARHGAALACPILEASGVEPPSGWLGAAAASIACRRARAILGGEAAHVVVPAALLDLPIPPGDDFPRDPFSSPGARERTLAAARARGAAYLDGAVARRPDGFQVRLVLRGPDDHEMGRGEGQGVALHQAVRAAMDPLVRSGALPQAAAADPEVATWSGVRDTGLLVALTDWDFASLSGVGFREEQARLAPRRAEIGPRWEAMKADAASRSGEGWDDLVAPPVDRSSPAAFARSVQVHALLDPRTEPGALADEANALAVVERSATGRAALAFAEALLRTRAGDDAKASALLFTAIREDPSGPAWNILNAVADPKAGESGAVRAYAAWWPEDGEAWNVLSIADEARADEARDAGAHLREMHRAHVLSPGAPLFAVHESIILVQQGKREEARAVAAELLSQSGERLPAGAFNPRIVAGEYVLASVEASEARFDAALTRARRVLSSLPAFGSLEANDVYLATLAMDLGMLLGRAPEIAEDFVRRFVDPQPPHLRPGRAVPGRVASVCALAPLPAALRCFDRLRSLVAAGFFREDAYPTDAPFLQGAEAYARGDYAAATAAWRPMARMPMMHQRNLLPDAFDRAGEGDLGRRVDAWEAGAGGPFNGASLAHFREAKRRLAGGDRDQGEQLARRVLDAWSVADAPVPAVTELRRLLAERRSRAM